MSITSLRKKTEEAQAQYDQNLTKCGKKLEKQVPELGDRIKSLQDMLYTSNLDDKRQDINFIVQLLQDLKTQIDEVVEQSKKINRFQITLSLEYKHFEKLDELLPEFNTIERLWLSRRDFHLFTGKTYPQQFLAVDFPHMEGFYQRMLKSATLCAKELELNEVSKVFKQEVEFLGETLETLRPLLDPSMGEKQWALIRSICQAVTGDPVIFEDVHNAEYTVKY